MNATMPSLSLDDLVAEIQRRRREAAQRAASYEQALAAERARVEEANALLAWLQARLSAPPEEAP